MVQYVEVQGDTVPTDVRIAADEGVEFAKRHLKLPDIAIRWFDSPPADAMSAWFQRPEPIVGAINQEQLDHIRIHSRLGPPKAGETAAHESFHLSCALNRQAKNLPMRPDDEPDEEVRAAAFGRRYLDELESMT